MRVLTCLLSFAIALTGGLMAMPATAAIVWVMFIGSDTSDCGTFPTPFKPCRTLQKGINQADPGDWVYFDLPVDYGRATITKSINLLGRGPPGGGTVGPTGTCITIAAGPNDVVTIANYTCDQEGAAGHGIAFNSGRRLVLDNVSVRNGAGAAACGVLFQPNSAATLLMRNSDVGSFGSAGLGGGVCVVPRSGATADGWLSGVSVGHNRNGLVSTSNSNAAIRIGLEDGDAAGNAVSGIRSAGANSVVYVKASSVTGNAFGLGRVTGGRIVSLGGNLVNGNTTNGSFSSTIAPN
jgi:hypothetical protein